MNIQEIIELYGKIYCGKANEACPIAINVLSILYGKDIYPISIAPSRDGKGVDIFLQNGDKMARLTCGKETLEATAEGRERKTTITPMEIVRMIEWLELAIGLLPLKPKRAA